MVIFVVKIAPRNWLFKKSLMEHYWDPHSWFGGFVNLCFFADYVASRRFWRGEKLAETQRHRHAWRADQDPQGFVGKFFHCMIVQGGEFKCSLTRQRHLIGYDYHGWAIYIFLQVRFNCYAVTLWGFVHSLWYFMPSPRDAVNRRWATPGRKWFTGTIWWLLAITWSKVFGDFTTAG